MISSQDFYIEQVATNRLAEFSYYIESQKQAIVVDPIRESDVYLNLAHQRGAEIKYILETHYHSDFISGHVELARKVGAKIIFGPNAKPNFSCYEAKDGESFQFGKIKVKVLHTPGHTIESTCYLLMDSTNRSRFLFTGDTLYIDDIGRIDLAANFSKTSEKELAEHFYDSLHDKIIPLPDGVLVCPSHGDAATLGNDTLGNAKRAIHKIIRMSKEAFVEKMIQNTEVSPAYRENCAKKNKMGYLTIDELLGKSLKPLTLEEFKKTRLEGHTILDTRDPADIQKGFVPGSITISLKTNFEAWVATLMDYNNKFILVTEPGKEKESIIKLARIGFENVEGYLDGGYKTWVKAGDPVQRYNSLLGRQLRDKISDRCQLLDVRQESEWNGGVIDGSQMISLSELEKRLQEIPKDKTIYVYCKLGGRSLIAYSILTKNGFQDVYEIKGGIESAKRAGIPLIIPMLFS